MPSKTYRKPFGTRIATRISFSRSWDELRNPVAVLKAGAHLLKKHAGTGKTEAVRESMERQLFHLSRLVEDLLDISRISEGKISLRKERVALGAILRSAIESRSSVIQPLDHRH